MSWQFLIHYSHVPLIQIISNSLGFIYWAKFSLEKYLYNTGILETLYLRKTIFLLCKFSHQRKSEGQVSLSLQDSSEKSADLSSAEVCMVSILSPISKFLQSFEDHSSRVNYNRYKHHSCVPLLFKEFLARSKNLSIISFLSFLFIEETFVMWSLLSQEIVTVTCAQIQDKAVWILHCTDTLGKDKNPHFFFSSAMST